MPNDVQIGRYNLNRRKKKKKPAPQPKQTQPQQTQRPQRPEPKSVMYNKPLPGKEEKPIERFGSSNLLGEQTMLPAGIEKLAMESVINGLRTNGRAPDPRVPLMMQKAGIAPRSQGQWDAINLTQPNIEQNKPVNWFSLNDENSDEPEKPKEMGLVASTFALTGRAGFKQVDYEQYKDQNPFQPTVDPEDPSNIFRYLTAAANFKYRQDLKTGEYTNIQQAHDLVADKRMMEDRLREAGIWDTEYGTFNAEDPYYDENYNNAVKLSAVSNSLQYIVYGTKEQAIKANALVNKLLRTPWGQDYLKRIFINEQIGAIAQEAEARARVLAENSIEAQQVSEADTIDVILRINDYDPEVGKRIIYSASEFSRPAGQSKEAFRNEFARMWGIEALPSEEAAAYQLGSGQAINLLTKAGVSAIQAKEFIEKNPAGAAAVHGVIAMAKVAAPFVKATEDFMSTVGKSTLATYAVLTMDIERGMSRDELKALAARPGGIDGDFININSFFGVDEETEGGADFSGIGLLLPQNLGDLVKKWQLEYKSYEGDGSPIETLIKDSFFFQEGRTTPWANDLGVAGDFTFWLLAGRGLDKGYRLGRRALAKGVYQAGRRYAPKTAIDYMRRTGEKRPLPIASPMSPDEFNEIYSQNPGFAGAKDVPTGPTPTSKSDEVISRLFDDKSVEKFSKTKAGKQFVQDNAHAISADPSVLKKEALNYYFGKSQTGRDLIKAIEDYDANGDEDSFNRIKSAMVKLTSGRAKRASNSVKKYIAAVDMAKKTGQPERTVKRLESSLKKRQADSARYDEGLQYVKSLVHSDPSNPREQLYRTPTKSEFEQKNGWNTEGFNVQYHGWTKDGRQVATVTEVDINTGTAGKTKTLLLRPGDDVNASFGRLNRQEFRNAWNKEQKEIEYAMRHGIPHTIDIGDKTKVVNGSDFVFGKLRYKAARGGFASATPEIEKAFVELYFQKTGVGRHRRLGKTEEEAWKWYTKGLPTENKRALRREADANRDAAYQAYLDTVRPLEFVDFRKRWLTEDIEITNEMPDALTPDQEGDFIEDYIKRFGVGEFRRLGRTAEEAYDTYAKDWPLEDVYEMQKSQLTHKWFRSNAETISQIDDPIAIDKIFIKTKSPETKEIAIRLAKSTDIDEITEILHELNDVHADFIDGGAWALGRARRAQRYINGGFKNPVARWAFTPIHFGRLQNPDSPIDMFDDVITLTVGGKRKKVKYKDSDGNEQVLDWSKELPILRRRMWDAETNADRQRVIEDFCDKYEIYLGPEKLKKLQHTEYLYRRGKGELAAAHVKQQVYFAGLDINGNPVEKSRFTPPLVKTRLHEELKTAKDEMEKWAKENKVPPTDAVNAYNAATKHLNDYLMHAGIINKMNELEKTRPLTSEEKTKFDAALDFMETHYNTTQPFYPDQQRNILQWRYDPKVMAYNDLGVGGRAWLQTNAWVLDPLTKMWKEMVMASFGFPVRVFAGDEGIRLISEDILNPKNYRKSRAVRKELKSTDTEGNKIGETPDGEVPPQSRWEHDAQKLIDETSVNGIDSDYTNQFGFSQYGDPDYFLNLHNFLRVMRRSQIVKSLIEIHKINTGEDGLPTDANPINNIKTLKKYIDKLAKSDTDEGRNLRRFFDETHRSLNITSRDISKNKKMAEVWNGMYETEAYTQWLESYAENLNQILKIPKLYEAMMNGHSVKWIKSKVNPSSYIKGSPDLTHIRPEDLPCIQAPEANHFNKSIINGNPFYWGVKVSPFHYIFNGFGDLIGGDKEFNLGPVRLSTHDISVAGLMGKFTRYTKTVAYSHEYWKAREELLAGGFKGNKNELHAACHARAADYMHKVTYSNDPTALEDLAKNVVLFGTSYRKFIQYWSKWAYDNPVKATVLFTQYPQQRMEGFDGNFLNLGVYNEAWDGIGGWISPMPFFGGSASAVSGDSGEDTSGAGRLMSALSNFTPGFSGWVTVPMRLLIESQGLDVEEISKIPGFKGLTMSPFKQVGDAYYITTGNFWENGGWREALWGDPDRLVRFQKNAVLSNIRIDPYRVRREGMEWSGKQAPAGEIEHKHGGNPRMALFKRTLMSKVIPIPGSVYTVDAEVSRVTSALAEYAIALRESKSTDKNTRESAFEKMASIRGKDPTVDFIIKYRDATPQERYKMDLDPMNASYLMWTPNMFEYTNSGSQYDPRGDVDKMLIDDERRALSVQEYEQAIYNKMASIYGGVSGRRELTGIIEIEDARKQHQSQMEANRKWAVQYAKAYCKKRGWDEEDFKFLMSGWDNPQLSFDWWRIQIRKQDPKTMPMGTNNPDDYNTATQDELFSEFNNGASPKSPKINNMTPSDKMATLQFSNAIYGGDAMIEESRYMRGIEKDVDKMKALVLKRIVKNSGDQWYFMSPTELSLIGIEMTDEQAMKYMDAQRMLHKKYGKYKELKPFTKEWREARNEYWGTVRKVMEDIPGGKMLAGGLAYRLSHIPYFTTPQVANIGTGPAAIDQWRAWNAYVKVEDEVFKNRVITDDDVKRINDAWGAVAITDAASFKDMTAPQKVIMEKARTRIWRFIFRESKRFHDELRDGYSKYYEGQGNSAASKEGKARIKRLNQIIDSARKANPLFDKDCDNLFGKRTNIAYRFLNWYEY